MLRGLGGAEVLMGAVLDGLDADDDRGCLLIGWDMEEGLGEGVLDVEATFEC